jgi:hypothetical protein
MGHEAAHAMLSHEGFRGRNAITTEKLCDMVSTMHTPVFIDRHSASWDLEIDGAAECTVGPFGLFTMVEARYTIGMVMDQIVNGLKDGTPRTGEWNVRFHEIQTRAAPEGVCKPVSSRTRPSGRSGLQDLTGSPGARCRAYNHLQRP